VNRRNRLASHVDDRDDRGMHDAARSSRRDDAKIDDRPIDARRNHHNAYLCDSHAVWSSSPNLRRTMVSASPNASVGNRPAASNLDGANARRNPVRCSNPMNACEMHDIRAWMTLLIPLTLETGSDRG